MVSDVNLPFRPSGVFTTTHSARTELAVFSADPPAMRFYAVAPDGTIRETGTQHVARRFRYVSAADIDGNGTTDFIGVGSSGTSLSIINRSKDGASNERELTLPDVVDACVLADLNRDGRKDILLFGKSCAGVLTLLQQPNGTLKPGPVLFPDISVNQLITSDLDGDGIIDILALNWLSEQLAVFYGIARLVYAEQIVVQLPSEPGSIAITPVSKQREFRVAIAFPDAGKIQVYSGNSLGDYRELRTLETDGRPLGVQFAHVNADDYLDLVAATQKGIGVWVGTSHSSFSSMAAFGGFKSIAGWSVADVDGDRLNDCVVVDRNAQRLIVMTNADNLTQRESPAYAVGASPMGLTLADFNNDGRLDIGVANSASSTFSVLLNSGDGRFSGQIVFPLEDNPTYVRRASGSGREDHTILASHSRGDKVTVMTLPNDMRQVRSFSVPTGGNPYVVASKVEGGILRFFVRHRSGRDNTFLLSTFEQINPRQFVERSIHPATPTRVIAMRIEPGADPDKYELLYATHERSATRTSIWLGESGPDWDFKRSRMLFSYADSSASTQWVLRTRNRRNPPGDVLVFLGPPRNELGIWYGGELSATGDSLEWIPNIHVASDDGVILEDIDGDGLTDITLLENGRRTVVTVFGKNPPWGRQAVTIARAVGVHSIRTASLSQGGETDLILSHPERGAVSIITNAFNR